MRADTPEAQATLERRTLWSIVGFLVALGALGVSMATGALPVTAGQIADAAGILLLVVTVVFFAWLFLAGDWTPAERSRLYVIAVFFLAYSLFLSVFEQAGSTLNLFADRNTNNTLFGIAFPSSFYQSTNPIFIIVFAPIVAWIWVRLGPRDPSSPVKFSMGLVGAGLGFVLLVPAAQLAASGALVSPWWLLATYFIHTLAEICLSPVGLSSMTTLAPARVVSLMMGVWFLGASVGNYIGGRLGGLYESLPLDALFGRVGLFAVACGVLMFVFAGRFARMMK